MTDAHFNTGRFIQHVTIAVTVAALSHDLSYGTTPPPKPDFKQNVNYVKWHAARVVCEGKPNAALSIRWPENTLEQRWLTSGLDPQSSDLIYKIIASGRPWSPKEFPSIKNRIDAWRPFMEDVRKASVDSCIWPPNIFEIKHLNDLDPPRVVAIRELGKALIIDAWVAGEEQGAGIVESCHTLIKVSAWAIRQRNIMVPIASLKNCDMAYKHLLRAAHERRLDKHQLGRAIESLSEFEVTSAVATDDMLTEWARFYDILQFLYPDGRFSSERGDKFLSDNKNTSYTNLDENTNPRLAAELTGKLMNDFFQAAAGPISRRTQRKLKKLASQIDGEPYAGLFCSAYIETYPIYYSLLLRTEASRRGTLLALSILKYERENQGWPESLDELGIAKSSIARIDPYTGREFIFELRGGRPCLYSCGANGKNNNGEHDVKWYVDDTKGDYVLLPFQEPGVIQAESKPLKP